MNQQRFLACSTLSLAVLSACLIATSAHAGALGGIGGAGSVAGAGALGGASGPRSVDLSGQASVSR